MLFFWFSVFIHFHLIPSFPTISAKVEMFDAIVFHQSNFDWDDLPLARWTQVIMPISCWYHKTGVRTSFMCSSPSKLQPIGTGQVSPTESSISTRFWDFSTWQQWHLKVIISCRPIVLCIVQGSWLLQPDDDVPARLQRCHSLWPVCQAKNTSRRNQAGRIH